MRRRRTQATAEALREKSANLLRMASNCQDAWLSAELHRLAEEFLMRAERRKGARKR
jgi:predicted mannosyl-3-phosphoglycerate phosphatase (HAD superfamily)